MPHMHSLPRATGASPCGGGGPGRQCREFLPGAYLAAILVRITGNSAFDAMPRITRRTLGLFPVQARLAFRALVFVAKLRLVRVVRLARCLRALPARVAGAIRGRIVVIRI